MIARIVNSLNLKWHLQRQAGSSPLREYGFKVLAILLSLIAAALAIEASGNSSLSMAKHLTEATLGSSYNQEQLLVLATPLILTGLAMLLGVRMMIFNMGAEGQLLMGAWAGAAVGLHLQAPTWLVLPLMFLAGAVGGGLWALGPALMRIKTGISEMLTTLLLNTAAIHLLNFFTMDLWRDTEGSSIAYLATKRIPYRLPIISGNLHVGILIAVFLVLALAFVLDRTAWGYELSSIGANQRAARFAGMPVSKHMLSVMLLSGAIAGVAGVIELTSTVDRLSGAISPGYGYIGINVAILAGSSPLALLPFGLFLAVVLNAGIVLRAQGLSVHIVLALTGLILLFSSVGEVVSSYRLVKRPTAHAVPGAESGESSDLSSAPQEERGKSEPRSTLGRSG